VAAQAPSAIPDATSVASQRADANHPHLVVATRPAHAAAELAKFLVVAKAHAEAPVEAVTLVQPTRLAVAKLQQLAVIRLLCETV
jgi:hypothetical protein